MHAKILFAASLLGATVAAPTRAEEDKPEASPTWTEKETPTPTPKVITEDANFDDRTAGLLDTEPVGIYKYLNWPGFSVGSEYISGVQIFGVKPHSPPNVAYSDVISSLFAGPSMQANYTDSKTESFDLKSFYYACIDVSAQPTAFPTNCTITALGYQGENLVANQSFVYGQDKLPSPNLDGTMDLGTFSADFTELTQVNFTYVNTRDIDTPPSFIGDDFIYDVHLEPEAKGWEDGEDGEWEWSE